jgi:hypothetical protein
VSESTRTSFGLRMLRAASLQADIYEEVEADRSSIRQATLVVLMASVAAGLGAWLRTLSGHDLSGAGLPLATYLAVVVLESPLVWLASGALAYMVGVTFLAGPETESDYLEVLRTTGFAFTPGILSAFGWLPDPFGLGALALARLWILVAFVIALRQALDFTTLRALGTFGTATALLWLLLWGLTVVPLPG